MRISQAYDQLAALAAKLGAPVATTASGKGVIAEMNDWALGTCGNFGQATANTYVGSADLVLAVGTRLGPADTTNENPAFIDPSRQTLVQIDIEPKNASWSFPCDTVVIGDAGLVLEQISDVLEAPSDDTVAGRKTAWMRCAKSTISSIMRPIRRTRYPLCRPVFSKKCTMLSMTMH